MVRIGAENKNRTLVLTNVHGDEIKSRQVGESLVTYPIRGVDTLTANVGANKLRKRFVDENMALSFAEADLRSPIYERRRAGKVLEICAGYGHAIDIHNVRAKGGDFAQLSPRMAIAPRILDFIGHIGIQYILVEEQYGVYSQVDHSALIEMSAGFEVERLRDGLDRLTNDPDSLEGRSPDSFTWLDYAGGLHASDVAREEEGWLAGLSKFDEVPSLSAKRKTLVMSWAPEPNSQGYHGELATPRSTPPVMCHD